MPSTHTTRDRLAGRHLYLAGRSPRRELPPPNPGDTADEWLSDVHPYPLALGMRLVDIGGPAGGRARIRTLTVDISGDHLGRYKVGLDYLDETGAVANSGGDGALSPVTVWRWYVPEDVAALGEPWHYSYGGDTELPVDEDS